MERVYLEYAARGYVAGLSSGFALSVMAYWFLRGMRISLTLAEHG